MSFYGVLNSVVQRRYLRRWSVCNDIMPVSVKVYFGASSSSAVEIRRFIFRPEQLKAGNGIYHSLLDRIRALFNGLNLYDVHLCWKDDDGDYVVFSSDDELKVAINSTTDNTLRIYIREKELAVRSTAVGNHVSSAVRPTGRSTEASSWKKPVDRADSSSRERDMTPLNHRHQSEMVLVDGGGDPPSPVLTNHYVGSLVSGVGGTLCSECQGEGRGVWYKCTVCGDFYLCSECENRGLHDHHIMVRITSVAMSTSCQGTPNFPHRHC